MAGEIGLGLIGVGVGLGLRHGIDWDHIAAITDVTASQPSRLRGMLMGTLYAGGHAAVVVALGLLAIWAGSNLPDSLDAAMEIVVGVTLLGLGGWVLWSVYKNPGELPLRSRWMLVFAAASAAYRRVAARLGRGSDQSADVQRRTYGAVASTGIGMIHGIGAETATQALLIAAAAGATSAAAGSFLLLAFAVGLVISNSVITIASTIGVVSARARRRGYLVLGLAFGLFSLAVGAAFIAGRGDLLPGFLA